MTDAIVREIANVPMSEIEYAAVNPPGLEIPRLRCFFFFRGEDPTKPDLGRFQTWSPKDLRERWYDMDKNYSRAASRVAISQLLSEINILREPLRAEKRFKLLVSSRDMAQPLRGEVEAGSEELLEHRFEGVLRSIMMENGGHVF